MSNIAMIGFGDLDAPRNGYHLRCVMLAKRLREQGNEVSVFQFSAHGGKTDVDGIKIHSIEVAHEKPSKSWLKKVIGFAPFKELAFPFDGFFKLRRLRGELKQYDTFYIESSLLVNAMMAVRPLGKKVVLDTHCMNEAVALKIKQTNKLSGTIRQVIWHAIESYMLKRADVAIAISEIDKDFMLQHYHLPPEKIELIPHIVDAAATEKYSKQSKELRQKYSQGFKKIAAFMGDLRAIQNIESEKFIREQLAPATPEVHYLMIGNNPDNLRNTKNITFTGFVDAFDPYILAADFCIAPMTIGSGVKTKVLDYLKYDKRVIATPVALEGIDPRPTITECTIDTFITCVKTEIGGTTGI